MMSGASNLSTEDRAGNPDRAGRPVVLQVLPALVTGGAERGAVDVAIALRRSGGTALVASAGGPMARELERHGIRHVTLPLASKNPLVMLRNAGRIEELIRRFGVDIVHARSRAPAWSALIAARRTGVPFMTTFHAPYKFGGRFKRWYNSVMARGERVIAISEFIRDHVLSNYDVDPGRVRLVHRGIDIDRFAPGKVEPARRRALAEAWRIPPDKYVVMLPGRLTRWKGQTVLIEALARLKRPDIHCLLVGSDQGRTGYRAELEAAIARHGLADSVVLADHCDDMAAAYALADVVVHASTEPEAFGRVIVEAQAMGCPVIVANDGAVRETVLAGQTGWVVPPGDPDALADAIREALALTPERRAAMAEQAVRFVAGRFTRDRMCRGTLAVYGELLDERLARADRRA